MPRARALEGLFHKEHGAVRGAPKRRVGRPSGVSVVSVVLLTILLHVIAVQSAAGATMNPPVSVAAAVTAASTTGGTGQLTIDQSRFIASVPSSATVGENYTLSVEVQSTANVTVPIIVRVIAPVSAIFVHPQILRADIPPNGTVLATFTIVPFIIWHQGPMNVTASLWVWFIHKTSTPQLVDQATAYVYSIRPSAFPYLKVLLISGATVAIVLVLVFYPNVIRRGRQTGITKTGQSA